MKLKGKESMSMRSIRVISVFAVLAGVFIPGVSLLSARDCPELVGRWPYGPVLSVAVSGESAYYGTGTVLQIADVSEPTAPAILGEIVLPDVVLGTVVSGDYAYVADGPGGLCVIDISDPTSPVEAGHMDTPGAVLGVAISGSYAYLADGSGGLRIIDISHPQLLVEAGSIDLPGWPKGVSVVGGHAYVADGFDGLRVIDISDPASPVEVGSIGTRLYVDAVAVVAGHACVADSFGGLGVIDISDPTSPVETGYIDTPGPATGVALKGSYAYVTNDDYGLRVIDISDPTSPNEVGFIDTPGSAGEVAIAAGHACVADYAGGMRVIDIGNPQSPVEVGHIDTPGSARGVDVSADHAYVAAGSKGLRVIDIGNPASPVEVGYIDTPEYAFGIAATVGYVYVATWHSGLRVIDISDPSSPVEAGFIDTPGEAFGVAAAAGYVYVADGSGGLRVIDIGDPTSPVDVGNIDTPGSAVGVAVSGSYAYVADDSGGLRVVDIGSPTSPFEAGFIDTPGSAGGVAVTAGYAFVADGSEGLRVIDISDPTSPVEAAHIDTLGYGVAVSGSYAYVAAGYEGLRVVNISDPTSPVEAGLNDTPGSAGGVVVVDGRVFVADSTAGMEIFKTCENAGPSCTPIWIAAAAAGSGANDSVWGTDLGINNFGDESLTYRFRFLPRDTNNSEVEYTEEFNLEPDTNTNFVDIWKLYTFADGAGSINVCVSDPDAAGIVSRTYNRGDQGTFGQAIVGKEETVGVGEKMRLGFLLENDAFRSNIGFMNASDIEITVNVEFFTADGTILGTDSIHIPPSSSNQWNHAFSRVTADAVDLGYADVWTLTEGGEFLTYASVVDNATSDPTTVWPYDTSTLLGESGFECTPIWIAAAASAAGAENTQWATDLGINNLGDEDLSYRFQLLPRGADNSNVAMSDSFVLASGESIVYRDAWQELSGGSGAGAINVCVDNGDIAGVISRTYNTGENGTFGQAIIGVRGAAPAKVSSGETVRLGYLFENRSYRTNIGFANAGPGAVEIDVDFFNMRGEHIGHKKVSLAPFSNIQLNQPFADFSGEIVAGFVDVSSNTPNTSYQVYASVIDNETGDPTTILPF